MYSIRYYCEIIFSDIMNTLIMLSYYTETRKTYVSSSPSILKKSAFFHPKLGWDVRLRVTHTLLLNH